MAVFFLFLSFFLSFFLSLYFFFLGGGLGCARLPGWLGLCVLKGVGEMGSTKACEKEADPNPPLPPFLLGGGSGADLGLALELLLLLLLRLLLLLLGLPRRLPRPELLRLRARGLRCVRGRRVRRRLGLVPDVHLFIVKEKNKHVGDSYTLITCLESAA